MGFFKDIRDISKSGKELGDYHGGMPSWKQAVSDIKSVADDRGQGEVLKNGTPANAVVKGPPMPVQGDRFAMQILLEVQPQNGTPYDVNYVFPAARMKAGLMPGQTIPIKIHPDDPQRVAVQWDAQKANIAAAGGDMAAAMQGMQNIYAGTADAALRRAQEARAAGQEPAAPANPFAGPVPNAYPGTTPAPDAGGGDVTARLAKLADLHKQGLVTDAEFQAKKAALLEEI